MIFIFRFVLFTDKLTKISSNQIYASPAKIFFSDAVFFWTFISCTFCLKDFF